MAQNKREWSYFDEATAQWVRPLVTLGDLDALRRDGKIDDHTEVINVTLARGRPKARGIPYFSISQLDVEFRPDPDALFESRVDKPITILSGPNNGGKTLLLKELYARVGVGGYLVACNRFSHVDVLNTRQLADQEHRQHFESFIQNYQTSRQNTDDSDVKLEQVITALKDRERERVFEMSRTLLGNTFSLKRTDPDNTFSPFYVDMDGENLRYGSSGTRLLLTLLGIIADSRFNTLLIDEPEIGLSPRIQAFLGRFLYDADRRKQYCPHLQQLFIATHSHLLLDRTNLSNNHIVTKTGNVVSVRSVHSMAEFHQLQFNMLGNELESMFLPSAIIVVEGESDAIFLTKLLQLHISGRNVAVVRAEGEGEVLKKINVFKEAFGNLASSPYRERLFVLLDQKISVRLPRIEAQGVPKGNIVLLSQNGIEYYYPQELVAPVFHCAPQDVGSWSHETEPIAFNGIYKSKKELAQCVADTLTTNIPLHQEISALVEKIRVACS
ncbi:MAG TPA: AAA family ATPase [Tepidisphaeraceae bacterium]|jgi:predicted ATPase